MKKDQAKITDEVTTNHQLGNTEVQPLVFTKRYEIISEAGLFKNGKQYDKGQIIELSEQVAKNFIAAGDVKEA